jgi:hypothetical protein
MPWLCGAATADITPDASLLARHEICTIGPWEQRALPLTSVRAPLAARVLFLSDGRASVALVSWDGLGDGVGLAGRIRAAWRKTELTDVGLFMAATHAHTTPDTLDFCGRALPDKYLRQFVERLTAAVGRARDAAKPVGSVQIQRRNVRGLARNRRPVLRSGQLAVLEAPVRAEDVADAGAVDDMLTVVRLCDAAETPLARVVHWACHGVCVQAVSEIAPGFIGTMENALQAETGIPTFSLNGAAGDINPVRMGDWKADEELAAALTKAVINLEREKVERHALSDTKLNFVAKSVCVERRAVPAHEARANESASQPETDNRHAGEAWTRFLQSQSPLVAKMPPQLDVPLAALRIGSLVLAGVGGELFAESGFALRRAAPAAEVLPVSYVNGYRGYLAPKRAYELGGYETACAPWCPLAAGEAERVVTELTRLVQAHLPR